MPPTASIRHRHLLTSLSPHIEAYWRRKAATLANLVDIVDPHRAAMATLRREYPAGTRVYRGAFSPTPRHCGYMAEVVTL